MIPNGAGEGVLVRLEVMGAEAVGEGADRGPLEDPLLDRVADRAQHPRRVLGCRAGHVDQVAHGFAFEVC